jgi:hypothetical protein
MHFSQTERREENQTLITTQSQKSDSPFEMGPPVNKRRARDLKTCSEKPARITCANSKGTGMIPQIVKRETTLTYMCRRRIKIISCNI